MLKQTVLIACLLLGHSKVIAQATNDVHTQGPILFVLYFNADTARVLQNWKFEKEDTFPIKNLLKMQSDVFGKLEYPRSYELNNTFDGTKNSHIALELDSIFLQDPTAQFTMNLFKGKKKKDQFKIEGIQIESNSSDPNPFLDSLSSPYLEMIQTKQIDSLVEKAYRTKELNESLDEFCKNSSKKKCEKAKLVHSFMMFSSEIVTDGLKSINPEKDPTFDHCKLTSKNGTPTLTVSYAFQDENEKKVTCNFSFILNDNSYQLSGIGTSSGMRFEEF